MRREGTDASRVTVSRSPPRAGGSMAPCASIAGLRVGGRPPQKAAATGRPMSATMKALRKMQLAKGLQMDTVAVPAIGPTEVLVRVKAASICGTDLHIYGWDHWSQARIKPPVTLGHEFCGTVERAGDEVRAVMAGDFVSAEMHVNCGHCHPCRRG